MATLLLRLVGPMQSWGTGSRFTERETGLEPSKSGVIGLLCAALGKPRWEPAEGFPTLAELAALRMGVRVDAPGEVGVDFQTAGGGHYPWRSNYGVAKANGSTPESVMSWRYFLQDAAFLVGLESDSLALLERLQAALAHPVWALSLGRKSYLPGMPVHLVDGLRPEQDLESALASYPLLVKGRDGEAVTVRRVVLDTREPGSTEYRNDVPLDFERRRFGRRSVIVRPLTLQLPAREEGAPGVSVQAVAESTEPTGSA
jgi:CRISPR system Cascade subunit CasD